MRILVVKDTYEATKQWILNNTSLTWTGLDPEWTFWEKEVYYMCTEKDNHLRYGCMVPARMDNVVLFDDKVKAELKERYPKKKTIEEKIGDCISSYAMPLFNSSVLICDHCDPDRFVLNPKLIEDLKQIMKEE